MIWTAIEAAAALVKKQVPGKAGQLMGTFLHVFGQHLKRKHGKQVEKGPKPAALGSYMLAAATCAVKRIALGQTDCPHTVGPNGLP